MKPFAIFRGDERTDHEKPPGFLLDPPVIRAHCRYRVELFVEDLSIGERITSVVTTKAACSYSQLHEDVLRPELEALWEGVAQGSRGKYGFSCYYLNSVNTNPNKKRKKRKGKKK